MEYNEDNTRIVRDRVFRELYGRGLEEIKSKKLLLTI